MSYIADSGIINRLVSGGLRIEDLPSDGPIVTPRALIRHIEATGDQARKSQLLQKLEVHKPKHASIGSIMLDGHYWEDFKLWDGSLFRKLKDAVQELSDSVCNTRDILLAEVAITNELIFLTANPRMADIVSRHGGEAVTLS